MNVPLVTSTSSDQDARLLEAARAGDLNRVKALLRTGLDVDIVDASGVTPLIFAAMSGHMEVVSELIRSGADRRHVDDMGYDAFKAAMLFGDFRGTTMPPFDEIMRLVDTKT